MRISNIKHKECSPLNYIEVRNYTNSLVNIPSNFKPKTSDNTTGFWTVRYKNEVDVVYQKLADLT
jgi:uncharacterized membrane protein